MPVDPADTWVFGYGSLMWNPGFAFVEARRARLTGYHRAFCVYSVHYRGTERQPGLVLGLDRGGVCDGIAFRVAPEQRAEVLAYLRRRELIYGVYREALVPVDLHPAPSPPHPTLRADLPPGTFANRPEFPSRMWGRVRGGGTPDANVRDTPPPNLPHEGGGAPHRVTQTSLEETPPGAATRGEGAGTAWAIAYIAERAHPAYAGCLPLAREAQLIRRSAGFGGTNLDYLLSTLRHLKELDIAEPRLTRLLTLTGAIVARAAAVNGNGPSPTAALARAWARRAIAKPRTVRDSRFCYRAKLG